MSQSCSYLFLVVVTMPTLLHAQGQMISTPPSSIDVDETVGILNLTFMNDDSTRFWGGVIQLINDTATVGSDVLPLTTDIFFAPAGTSITTVSIVIIDDAILDPDESFTVALTSFTTGQQPTNITINIIDNENPPVSLLQMEDVTVKENIGTASFIIARNDGSTHKFNVSVDTVDNTATEEDYSPLFSDLVRFGENEDNQTIQINIINDLLEEPTEMFSVTIHGGQITGNITFRVAIEDNDSPNNFNCGRGTSQPCLNNGMCNSEGSCNCPLGYQGVNCGIETDKIKTGCGCVHGTCVNDGTTYGCVCDVGFAGYFCDRKAYFHFCNSNGVSVCLSPFSIDTFNGIIYVEGESSLKECHLGLAPSQPNPDDSIVDWCKGYAAFIEYNSTCTELESNQNVELSTSTLQLRVQYHRFIQRDSDELVILTCRDSNDADVYEDTTLTVTTVSGSALEGLLIPKDIVLVCLHVNQDFNAVLINRIVTNNSRSDGDFRFLEVYNEGCYPNDVLAVGPYWFPSTERYTMCFRIEVFVFAHDHDLSYPAFGIEIEFTVYERNSLIAMPTCGESQDQPLSIREKNRVGATLYLVNPLSVNYGMCY